MRTTINVDNELLDALIKQTKMRTKTQAIETAIREYLGKKAVDNLISLSGRINISPDWREDEEVEMNEYKDNC